MKLKPEERTKAVQLASLTAVVFVFGGVNIYRQLQRSPPARSPTTVTPASETTPNGVSAAYMPGSSQTGCIRALPARPRNGLSARRYERMRGIKMDMYADNLHEAKRLPRSIYAHLRRT